MGPPHQRHTAQYAALPDQTKAELVQRWDAGQQRLHSGVLNSS